jgi:hypothetical protein
MKHVDGNDIIYHYLQKNLLKKDEKLFQSLIQRLIRDLSIWWPVKVYKELPILLPFVVRDPSCRASVGGIEAWGEPDRRGYFRDDNSLIKSLPRSFRINSPSIQEYAGCKMSNGFVASHIWQGFGEKEDGSRASRDPRLNSFAANLVWLPKQVSKMSDRESSYTQLLLKHIARRIYFPESDTYIKKLWGLLPIQEEFLFDFNVNELNYFEVGDSWLDGMKRKLKREIDMILNISSYKIEELPKVRCSRYMKGLRLIGPTERSSLNVWLRSYKRQYLD